MSRYKIGTKYRVGVCPHLNHNIMQIEGSPGEWMCLHQDTREQELMAVEQFELHLKESEESRRNNPYWRKSVFDELGNKVAVVVYNHKSGKDEFVRSFHPWDDLAARAYVEMLNRGHVNRSGYTRG